MGITNAAASITATPGQVWLGAARRQMLVASASRPGLYQLVTRTPDGLECSCPGWPGRWRCRHTKEFTQADADVPVITVRPGRIRLNSRQALFHTGGDWRLITYPRSR